jgi:hypothetical protein
MDMIGENIDLCKLKKAEKPDPMAGYDNTFTPNIVQNKYKNSAKAGEVGMIFALSLSLSLIINKCIVVSRDNYLFSQIATGVLFVWYAGFFYGMRLEVSQMLHCVTL